jgi:serine protease Do
VGQLGLSVTPQRGGGVAISKVEPDGLAAERGLKTGDVILEAGGRQIASAADLQSAIEAAQKAGRRSLLLQVKSGNTTRFVAVPAGRG